MVPVRAPFVPTKQRSPHRSLRFVRGGNAEIHDEDRYFSLISLAVTFGQQSAESPGYSTKYLAWGCRLTIAEVDCSGSNWNSSERVSPIRSAPSSDRIEA